MANIKQQKKRVDIAARQRLENLRYRSTIKTLAKRLENAVADGEEAAVAAEYRELVRTIDKAAARGALHKNTAARKKAQAARVVDKLELVILQLVVRPLDVQARHPLFDLGHAAREVDGRRGGDLRRKRADAKGARRVAAGALSAPARALRAVRARVVPCQTAGARPVRARPEA